MKNAKKIMALLLCAVLLVGATIAGTVAYLTSTDEVKNTFAVGNVKIYLDETDIDGSETGTIEEAGRDKENEYHLMPGKEYAKDPRVTVRAGSEPCYIFVRVVNDIAAIEAAGNTTIAKQMEANWHLVDGETNVYYYKDVLTAGDTATVFEKFVIADNVTNDTLAAYAPNETTGAKKTITVTAYAVQQEGFATAQAAWDASFGA